MTWVTTTREKTEIRLLKIGLTLVAENLEKLAIQLSNITDQSGTHALGDYPEALQILNDLEAISDICHCDKDRYKPVPCRFGKSRVQMRRKDMSLEA